MEESVRVSSWPGGRGWSGPLLKARIHSGSVRCLQGIDPVSSRGNNAPMLCLALHHLDGDGADPCRRRRRQFQTMPTSALYT